MTFLYCTSVALLLCQCIFETCTIKCSQITQIEKSVFLFVCLSFNLQGASYKMLKSCWQSPGLVKWRLTELQPVFLQLFPDFVSLHLHVTFVVSQGWNSSTVHLRCWIESHRPLILRHHSHGWPTKIHVWTNITSFYCESQTCGRHLCCTCTAAINDAFTLLSCSSFRKDTIRPTHCKLHKLLKQSAAKMQSMKDNRRLAHSWTLTKLMSSRLTRGNSTAEMYLNNIFFKTLRTTTMHLCRRLKEPTSLVWSETRSSSFRPPLVCVVTLFFVRIFLYSDTYQHLEQNFSHIFLDWRSKARGGPQRSQTATTWISDFDG